MFVTDQGTTRDVARPARAFQCGVSASSRRDAMRAYTPAAPRASSRHPAFARPATRHPGAVGLAVQLAFRNVEMAGNRTAADDRNLQFREINRFDGRFAVHHAIDDLGLVLDPPIGMAVAQLIGKELLEFCLVLRQRCLSECLDGLSDPGLVAALGRGGGVGEQARRSERQGAGSGQITTADWHDFLPRSRFCVDAAQSNRESGRAATGATQLLGGFAAFWRCRISAFNCRIMRANSGLL